MNEAEGMPRSRPRAFNHKISEAEYEAVAVARAALRLKNDAEFLRHSLATGMRQALESGLLTAAEKRVLREAIASLEGDEG